MAAAIVIVLPDTQLGTMAEHTVIDEVAECAVRGAAHAVDAGDQGEVVGARVMGAVGLGTDPGVESGRQHLDEGFVVRLGFWGGELLVGRGQTSFTVMTQLSKVAAAHHGRAVRLSLTEQGRELAARGAAEVGELLAPLLGKVGASERQRLGVLPERLLG